jgi:hypothetical protein
MKPVRLTRHAQVDRVDFYGLDIAWVERIAREPEWTEPDPQPGVERRFGSVAEWGGRVLRVACIEEDDHIRVLTVHPDRDARRPDAL